MTICVCGGGNEGHALAAFLSAQPGVEVNVLTRRPKLWRSEIVFFERATGVQFAGTPKIVSSDPADVIPPSDIILISLPSQFIPEVLRTIAPYYNDQKGMWIGSLPGTGGFEWMVQKTIGKALIFGTTRVPFECRIKNYGREVTITGKKRGLAVAAVPRDRTEEISEILQGIFHVPVSPLNNYLAVTLTTSNAILHPSRLYRLFQGWTDTIFYERPSLFYDEWDDTSSEVLLACDKDVQDICRAIPLDMTAILPILRYYEVADKSGLTQFFRNCASFKGEAQHYKKVGEGYVPNFECRYFKEDFPYGLLTIRAVAQLFDVPTPMIDDILIWGQRHLGGEYLVNGKVNVPGLRDAGIPQLFGIHTARQLLDFVRSSGTGITK